MSEFVHPSIKVVCEGDTDITIIQAIIASVIESDPIVTQIQPEKALFAGSDYGELGSGWHGVRNWCQQQVEIFGCLTKCISADPLRTDAALIIHVDADVAGEKEINCEKPCPPASDTVDELRKVVLNWCLEKGNLVPDRVVLCIPSKSIEAWVLAALHPRCRFVNSTLESRKNPEALLVGKSDKLVHKKSNRYKKNTAAYKDIADSLTAAWQDVCNKCSQAARFTNELIVVLGP